MVKHILDIITVIGFWYFIFIDISYIIFKYIKKDPRFFNISMWKYLQFPIKTIKGEL